MEYLMLPISYPFPFCASAPPTFPSALGPSPLTYLSIQSPFKKMEEKL